MRLVHDRWVSTFTEPFAARLSELTTRLESPVEKVYEIWIRTTPERLWQAITDPDQREKFQFGVRVESEWTVGAPITMTQGRAEGVLGTGVVLEVDPPHRLVHTMEARWSDEVAAEGTSRVTWSIQTVGDSCGLTLTHDQLREGGNDQVHGGWPMILSGLKTWLESAELLTTPGSLMYQG